MTDTDTDTDAAAAANAQYICGWKDYRAGKAQPIEDGPASDGWHDARDAFRNGSR
jgi:hypothetical protein